MAGNIDGSNDLNTIHDEDTLRHMWQETEDFGRKKEIRLRMYKLREERLKSYYIKRETNTSTSSSSSSHTNSKSMITSSHTDSLNDRGFMSAKTNEIRDSTSPALEMLGQKTYQLETSVTSKSKTTADDTVSKAYSTKENNIQQHQYSTSQCNILDKQVETSSQLLGQLQSSSITDNVTNILDTASKLNSNDISNQIVKSTVTAGQQLATEMEKSSRKEHNLQLQRQIIDENSKILYKSQCGMNNSDVQNSASEHTSVEKMNIPVVPTRQVEKTNSSHHRTTQQHSDDTINRSTTTAVDRHINTDNSYLDSSIATNEHHNVNLSVDLDCVTQPAATNVQQTSKISQDVSATHNAFASSLRASASPSPTPSSGFCVSRQASPSPKSSTGHSSPEKTPRVSPEKQVYDHISSKLTASFRNRIASTSTHHSLSSSHTPGGAEKVRSIQLQPCFTSEYDSDDSSATYKKIDTEIKVVDKKSSSSTLKTTHHQQLQKDSYGKLQQNRDSIVANTSKPSDLEINRENSSSNLSSNSKMQTQTQSRRQSYPPHRSDGVTTQVTRTVEQRSFSQNVPQHKLKLNPVCTSPSSIQRNTRTTSRKNNQVERDSKENKTSDMQQKPKQRESSHSPTKSSIVHKDIQKGTPLISCIGANLEIIPNDSVPKTFTPTATSKPRPSPQKGEIKKCATLPAKSKTTPNSKLISSQENDSDTSISSSSSTSSLSDEMDNYDSIGGSGVTIEEIIDADDNKQTQVQQQKIGLLQSTVDQMVKPLSTTTGTLLPQESSLMSHQIDDKQIKSQKEIDDEQKQSSHLTHFELIKDESMEQPSTEMIAKQQKIIKEGEIDGSIPPVEVVLGKQAAKLFTHNQQPKQNQLLPVQQQKKQQLQHANRISTLNDENTAQLKQNKQGHLKKMTPVKIVTTTKSTVSNNNFDTTPTSTRRKKSNRQQLTSVEINAKNGPSKAPAGRVKATESSTIKSPNKLVCGTPHMSMQLPSLKKTTALNLQMTPHKLNSIPTSSNKKQKKERLLANLNNTVKDVKQKLWKESTQKQSPSSRKPLSETLLLSNLNDIARYEKKLGKKDAQKISLSSRKPSADYTSPKRAKEHSQIVDKSAKYLLKRPSTTKVAHQGEKVQSACKTQPSPNLAKTRKPKSTSILLGKVGHKTDSNYGDLNARPKNERKYPRHLTHKEKTSTIKQSQTPQSKLKLHNESNTTKASYLNHTSTKPQCKFNQKIVSASPVMQTLPRCDVKTKREQPPPQSAQPRAKKLFTLTQPLPRVDKKTPPRKDTPNITPSKYKVVATTIPTTSIHNQSRSNKGTTKVVQSKSSELGINTHPMRLSNVSTLSNNTSNDVLLYLEDVDQDLETQTENVDTAEMHTLEHQQQQNIQNLNVIVRMPSSSRETTPNLPNTEYESYPKVVDDEDVDTACPRYADRVIESDDLVTLKRITVPRFEKITHLEEDDQQDETCDKVQPLPSPTKNCEKMLTPTQQTTHINVAERVSQFQDGHRTSNTTAEPQMTHIHQAHSDGKNVRETKKIWEREAEADQRKRICKSTDTNENTTITPLYDADTNTDNRVTHHKIVSKKLADDDYRLFEAEHASNISQVKQQSTNEAEPRENKTETSNSTYNHTRNQFQVTNESKIEGVKTYQEGGKALSKTKPIVAPNSLTESTSSTNYNSKIVTDAPVKGQNICNGTSGITSASTKSNCIQPDCVGLSPKPIKMTTVEIKPSKQFDHTAIIRFNQRIAPDEQQPKAESRNYERKTTRNDDSSIRSRSRSTSNSSRATKSPSPTKVDSRNEYQSQHSLITRGSRKLFSGHPIKTKVAKAATPESPHKASAVKSPQRLLQHQTQTGSQSQQRSTDSSKEKRSSTVTTTTTTTTTTATDAFPITTSWQQMKEIEEIDDLELLQAMLEEETRYDRRSKIRAQIRAIRREMELGMKKSPSKSPSPEKWLSAQSSTPASNVRVDKTQYVTATTVDTDRRERAKKRLFAAPTTTTPADSNYSARISSHGGGGGGDTVSLRNLTTTTTATATATAYEKDADNTNAINSDTRAPTKTPSTTKSANADSIRSSNSASVYCSRTAMVRSRDKDGKVSVLQEQIDGQIVAKNGREPVGHITHTRIGYETAAKPQPQPQAKSRRSVSPTTPRSRSMSTSTSTQRRISGQRNSNSTARGLSSTSSLIRKLSNERFEKAQRKFNGNCDMGGDDTSNSRRRDSTRTTNNATAIYTEHGHRSPSPTKHHYDATADVQTRNYLAQRTQNAGYEYNEEANQTTTASHSHSHTHTQRSNITYETTWSSSSSSSLSRRQEYRGDQTNREENIESDPYRCGLTVKDGVADGIAALDHHQQTTLDESGQYCGTDTAANRQLRVVQTQTPLISSTPAVSLKSCIDYADQRSRDVRSQSASTVAHATATANATAVKTTSSVSLSRNAMATTDSHSATQTTEPDSTERVDTSSSPPTTFETRCQQTESRLAAASIATKQDHTTTSTATSSASSSSSHTIESKYATETSTRTRTSATSTTNSSRIHKANSVTSPFAKFRQLDRQNSLPSSANAAATTTTTTTTTTRTSILNFADSNLTRSASSIKDRLLNWVKAQTRDYQNVQIDNFSTSWNNGLAFCALIHHFCPYAFDYDKLTPQQRRYNFELAFRIAEQEAGIVPLLDVDDMVIMKRPDWKCVFTYVQTIYQRFYASPEANAL